jgi:hypothetical protein
MNLFFTGGGILGMFYYAGMLKYLRDNKVKVDKVYGISAGSAIGVCLLLDIDIENFIEFIKKTTRESSSLTELQIKGVTYVLEHRPDAYKILTNRLYIGLTDINGFRYKSKFKSNVDLADAILCSSCIPVLSSWKSKYIDGRIAFKPSYIPSETIVMNYSISLLINMFIPPENIQLFLIENGYVNAGRYIKSKNRDVFFDYDLTPKPLIQLFCFLHDAGCLINPKTIKDLGKLNNN